MFSLRHLCTLCYTATSLLPPASEGCREVIFSVCPHLGGYPISGPGGVPHLRSGGYPVPGWRDRGIPSQVRGVYPISGPGGYPISGLGGRVPHLRSGGVPCPRSGGVPHPMSGGGVPHLRSGGYPISGLGGDPGPHTPPVKGKLFDTRFGLIHVQTGKKKIFAEGLSPPLPRSKGENF